MSLHKMIPPIRTKGIYKLKEPYSNIIRPNEIYECGAIRYFKDLENNNRNVFKMYYEPYGLTIDKYIKDRNDGQVLVTLLSAKYPPVYVPSSYIESYPDLNNKNYNKVVLSASLGPLPEDVILEPTIQAMKNVISDFIGVEVEVNVGLMPLTDAVSADQHLDLESVRLGAINNLESDYSRNNKLNELNASLQQKVTLLEKIIKDYGILD